MKLQLVGRVGLYCGVAAICLGLATTTYGQAADENATILKDFSDRVDKYLKLQKAEGGATPSKPTSSVTKIKEGQQSLADKIRAARPDAKQGDIFSPEISALFKKLIAEILAGPQGNKIRASLRRAEPVKGIEIKVNGSYPRRVPLQSTPPTLLANLPRLPKELEYRIVGHDLVLRDINANLIVDHIPGAIPAS
jgi:hypothetical protein